MILQYIKNSDNIKEFERDIAGWSSQVARRAHNPKVVGSSPAPATTFIKRPDGFLDFFLI